MNHNSGNSHSNSNSNINQYATLADKAEVEELSLHAISDNSISISTEQALADKAEERQLKIELKLLDDNIREISSVLSTYTHTKEDALNFEDKDMMLVLPVLVIKKEYRNSVKEVIVRGDVQLFKDKVNNVLTKANHPLHSGGCAHLLDNKTCYREQVGDKKATLPTTTYCQELSSTLVTSTVVCKQYE